MPRYDVEMLTTVTKRVVAKSIADAEQRAKGLFDTPVLRSITRVEPSTLREGDEVPTIEIV